MQTPEDIIKRSKYGDNALIEDQDKVVEAMVDTWNSIISDYENKTILFALRVKKLLEGFPDKTKKEVIDKFREHPKLKQSAYSRDRIMQGLRLVERRNDLIEFNSMTLEQRRKVRNKPYCKNEETLEIHWEFYYNIYKYSIDPGMIQELEEKAKKERWGSRKALAEARKLVDERREPNKRKRFLKGNLIKELLIMLRCLTVEELESVKAFIIGKFNDKLEGYKKWKENETN